MVFLPMVIVPPALALQDPAQDTGPSLESLKALMQQKVYSATKGTLEMENAPATLAVFTARDIETSGARTLADLLKQVPGIVVLNDDKGDQMIWIRGVVNGDNERVLLLVDGIPFRETGASSWAPDERFDLHAVERIEIVRGPGSALYGGNAFAGVISVFTRTGIGRMRLRGSTGSQGTASLAYQDGEEGPDLWWSFAASAFRSDGWASERGRTGAPTANGTARDARTIQARAGLASGFSGSLAHGLRNYDYPLHDVGTQRESTYAYTLGSLVHEGQWGAWGTVVRGYADQARFGFVSRVRNLDQTLKQEKIQKRQSLVHGLDAQAAWAPSPGKRLLLGMNVEHNIASRLEEEWNPTSSDPAKRYFINSWLSQHGEGPGYNTARTRNLAFFAQHESRHFSDRLTLTAGLRWARFEGFGNEYSPRAGVVVKATGSDTFKVLAGKAFRPPTLRQLFVRRSDGKQPGNPELRPEVGRTFEAEWLHRFTPNTALRTIWFQSRYDRALVSIAEGPWQNGTLPRTIRGLELEFQGVAVPASGPLKSISYTLGGSRLLRAAEDSPARSVPLEYVPQSTANARLTLQGQRMHLSTSLGWMGRRNPGQVFDPSLGAVVDTYHGSVPAAYAAYKNRDNLGAILTQDLALGWRFRAGWSLDLAVHNLWNKKAFNPTYDPDTYYDVTREPRAWTLRLGLVR